jgi:hypothetical protein
MKTAICVLAITAGVARADTFYEYGPSTPFAPVEQLAIAACDVELRGAIADVTLCSASSTPGR